MDDEAILSLFYARAEQAITELERSHGSAVRSVAAHILNDRRDVQECENDTYLAAWNTIPPQRPHPLVTYVCRIARNLAIKIYHANTARKRNSAYDLALDELESSVPALDNVENELEARALGEAISAFLDGCGSEDRFLFVRRYWFADPVPELAARAGRSTHWVSVRLFRLRERLQAYLEREGVSVWTGR